MKQLDKKSVWLFFLNSIVGVVVFSFFFVFIGLAMLLDGEASVDPVVVIGWLVLGIIIFLAVSYLWAKWTYHFYRYELTDLGFRKESGIIYKKYVTIPYTRIQNVDIHRGILARILGLSDLLIQTAGASATVSRNGVWGAGAEGRLPGVSKADAEVLRDELIQRASRASQGQGL